MKWIKRVRTFLRNVKSEVKKVSWPSQEEVVTMTVLILGLVIVLSAYIGLVDEVYRRIIQQILALR